MSVRKPQPSTNSGQTTPADSEVKVWTRFQRFFWDIIGVGALALALMTLLGLVLPELATGVLLLWWTEVLWLWFGWGSLWVVVIFAIGGLLLLRRTAIARSGGLMQIPWGRVVALEVGAFASMAWLAALGKTSFER